MRKWINIKNKANEILKQQYNTMEMNNDWFKRQNSNLKKLKITILAKNIIKHSLNKYCTKINA